MNTNPTPASFRLYFGHARPDGGRVSPEEFRAFLADDVAHVLLGWTSWTASGGWRDASTGALVLEDSTVLETFADDADALRPVVEALAARYAARFRQDCVAVLEVPGASASFVGPARDVETVDALPEAEEAEPVDLDALDVHALGLAARDVLRGGEARQGGGRTVLEALGFTDRPGILEAVRRVRPSRQGNPADAVPEFLGEALRDASDPKY